MTVQPIGKFISEGATEYQLDWFENKENSNIKANESESIFFGTVGEPLFIKCTNMS